MKVLSLFDWMACGYEALVRAWIPIDVYYASEIDKYAIQIAKKNHPDIIEIWDVTQIKWEDYKDIDIIIGGSPCQWFSMAWKMLNFDDPRSKLFFEFVRLVKEIQPKYFLLENVKMKKEFRDKISEMLWAEPILIDSALVSAQHRERYYRTNIPWVMLPEDKWIMLKDIIITEKVEDRYYLTETQLKTIRRNFGAKGKILNETENLIEKLTFPSRIKPIEWLEIKTPTLPAAMGTWWWNVPCIVEIPKEWEKLIDVVDWEVRVKQATKQWYIVAEEWDWISLSYPSSTTRRWRVIKWKSNTLTACGQDSWVYDKVRIRKLTPIECERLQTMPDNYTAYYNKQIQIKNIKSLICNKVRWLNVVLNDVKENQNGNECVVCIEEDLINTEAQNYQLNHPIGMQNVNIVIEKLEKNDEVQDECVIDITKTDLDMEIPYTLTRLKRKNEKQWHTDIIERLIEEQNTSSLWRIKFEGIWINENVSIILTLLKRIMLLKIFTYVKTGLDITISINSWRKLQQNCIRSELLLSKIESIGLMSDTQRYKMLWNWWTCDVIAHIFSFIPKQ